MSLKFRMKLSSLLITAMLSIAVVSGCQSQRNEADSPGGAAADPASIVIQSPWIATKNTTRIHTSDPAEAAMLVSHTLWTATNEDNRPGSVVLVDPASWQLAAVSANLIHHPSNGPVLYVDEQNGMPDSVMDYVMSLQPRFELSPAEGPYNHAWIVGDQDTITYEAQAEIDDMLEIIPASGTSPGHGGH